MDVENDDSDQIYESPTNTNPSTFSNDMNMESNSQDKSQLSRNYQNKSMMDNRFILLTELGRGAFSKVWRSIDIQTKETIALKIFFKSTNMNKVASTAIDEVKAMQKVESK